jgi:hypothetical protein
MVYIYCCKHFVYVNCKTNSFITKIGVDLNVIRNVFENWSPVAFQILLFMYLIVANFTVSVSHVHHDNSEFIRVKSCVS